MKKILKYTAFIAAFGVIYVGALFEAKEQMLSPEETFSEVQNSADKLNVAAAQKSESLSLAKEFQTADNTMWQKTKDKTAETSEAVKEKSGDAWEATKEKTGEAWDKTKDKSGELWDNTKEKSSDAWEATKDTSKKAWEKTKDAVTPED